MGAINQFQPLAFHTLHIISAQGPGLSLYESLYFFFVFFSSLSFCIRVVRESIRITIIRAWMHGHGYKARGSTVYL